jgi:hypothetical protein
MDNDRQDGSTPATRVRRQHDASCRVAFERTADGYTFRVVG